LPADRRACYQVSVSKHTIWTAPASPDVPALNQLDMRAPLAGASDARKRAARAKARTKTALGYYVSRSSAESLRKLVK
jgi:hypothetical protein